MRTLLIVLILISMFGCATSSQSPNEEEYARGYRAAMADMDTNLLAPAGLASVLEMKVLCETRYQTRCGLYGGFAPMDDIILPKEKVQPNGKSL